MGKLVIWFGLVVSLASCLPERYNPEVVKFYYPNSGVTIDNFAPLKNEIILDDFALNPGELNEYIKSYNTSENSIDGSELEVVEFGPWNFPDTFLTPYERDLMINYAIRIAEIEAPKNGKSNSKMKPVAYIFWKDELDPRKFGFFVKYRKT